LDEKAREKLKRAWPVKTAYPVKESEPRRTLLIEDEGPPVGARSERTLEEGRLVPTGVVLVVGFKGGQYVGWQGAGDLAPFLPDLGLYGGDDGFDVGGAAHALQDENDFINDVIGAADTMTAQKLDVSHAELSMPIDSPQGLVAEMAS
jgi:hypothetical protein